MIEQATITLNPEQIIGEVHDHLYGANLEHLGQAIYGGVWAEMLRDRKFSGNDHMYTSTSEGLHNVHPNAGVVVPWEAVNPNYANVLCVHDNTTFYTGQQSQRITIRQEDDELHGIKQVGLYLQANHNYDVRIVLKGEKQTVTIQLGDEVWKLQINSDNWQTYHHTFNSTSTHPNGEFSITLSQGSLWVGCASVMPSNNIKGFRPDVLEALKDWSPTHLRWPGGNFVSAYHWEQAIGDRDERSPYLDPTWWQWESNDMGTDEFIDLCRLIGSEPVLTINMGNGTTGEAAAWVEYCNGDGSTHYGALRAENGHTAPHHVKVWFVGNEQFGNWQVGHVDAETYARRYLEYAKPMRAVDDSLTLIGVGVPTDLYGHWNELVLKIASEEMDQFSIHYYSIRTEKWDTPPSPEHLFLPKIAASYEVAQMLDDTLAVMDQFSTKPLPMAFDEWNTYYGAKSPDFIEDYNLADAIYTGAVLNACIQRADRIIYSAIYHLTNVMGCYLVSPLYEWQAVNFSRNGGWIPMSIGENPIEPAVIKMPATLVLELMTTHRGTHAIQCQVESPTFSSPSAGNLPAYDAIPSLDASATIDESTQQIYLSLVNRSVDSSLDIKLDGIAYSNNAIIYRIQGDNPLATNSFEEPDNIVIQTQDITLEEFVLPPHSYTMVIIQIPSS
jgi:alpha-L-arabinofuranosidase